MAPKSTKWRQNSEIRDHRADLKYVFVFKPCFHETIVILVPLEHRGFLKVIFDVDRLILFCSLRFFVLCFLQHFQYIFFLQKTLVNAQPSSCPLFEEIATHKQNVFYFYFCVCVCVCFYFFIFVLIFGYPVPTPWARSALFWIDFVVLGV